MRSKLKCNIKGCRYEHHARGYCNRHYKKLIAYGDPLAGRMNKSSSRRSPNKDKVTLMEVPQPQQPQPQEDKRPKLARDSEAPFSFLANQKFIERLYKEILKALHEPLYIAHNSEAVLYMLRLAVKMAGYDKKNNYFLSELIADLESYAQHKDSLRFMAALANWEQSYERFEKPEKREQLSIVFQQ